MGKNTEHLVVGPRGTVDAGLRTMGPHEARHASLAGAPAAVPIDGAAVDAVSAGQVRSSSTPLWMDASAPHVGRRRGASPAPRSGLSTALFFGLIIAAVSAAGIFGVAFWGPEKAVKSRTQFASNPPPPTELPSLPTASDPAAAPPVVEAAPEAEPAAPAVAASSGKKPKKSPKAVTKKH